MAGGEDDAVYDGHGQIAELCVALAEECHERHGDDVKDADGYHCAHRAAGVELGTLVDVLCHRYAECAVRQIDAGISEHQNSVCH